MRRLTYDQQMARAATPPEPEEFSVSLSADAATDGGNARLATFARGFLITGRHDARFLWRSGRSWLAVSLTRQDAGEEAVRAVVTTSPAVLPRGITPREAEVLTLVALGLTNGQIALRLGTRPRTVSTQVERLLGKLGQAGRAGLAAMAVDASLIVLPLPGGPVETTSISQAEIQHAATALRPEPARQGLGDAGFASRRPILLGTLAPLEGAAASDGLELVRGASIAVREVNERGGVDGRPVQQIVERVDLLDARSVDAAVDRLIQARVDAIHTNYVTAESPDALRRIADYGRPFLHTATLESQVSLVRSDPGRYGVVFQTCPSEEFYRLGFAAFLEDAVGEGLWAPSTRRVVAVEADSSSSHLADRTLQELLQNAGWDLVDAIRVPLHRPGWAGIARQIEDARADVLLISHFLPDVARLQRILTARRFPGLIYYVYAPAIPRFQAIAGRTTEGILWSTVTARYDDAMGERFHRRFTLRYGQPPGWSQASASYDQAMLLADAWTANRSADPDAACEHLRTTITRGLNGVYYLGTDGQSALCYPYQTKDPTLGQALMIYQVQSGVPVALSPPPKGDLHRFIPPRPSVK